MRKHGEMCSMENAKTERMDQHGNEKMTENRQMYWRFEEKMRFVSFSLLFSSSIQVETATPGTGFRRDFNPNPDPEIMSILGFRFSPK